MALLINEAKVKRFIQACHPYHDNVPVTREFLLGLHNEIIRSVEYAVTMPSNRKRVQDLMPKGGR